MSERRVAVTGGTGFVGVHLVERLLAAGDGVTVLARDPARVPARWHQATGATVVAGSVTDGRARARLLEGASHVVHMAAVVGTGAASEADYRAVHVDATRALVEEAAAAGVRRFVHVSSVGIYGDTGTGIASEESPARPEDAYERSKWQGEEAARAVASVHALELCVVRPAGVYGRGDRRLLKLFRALARGRFVMIGRGANRYHLVHVDDVVDGIVTALDHPAAVGRDFILAGPEAVAVRDLVGRIARQVGRPPPRLTVPLAAVRLAARLCVALCRPLGIAPPLYPERVAFFYKERRYAIDRARDELGLEPRIDLDEGLARTLAGYRADGWL